MNNEDDRQFQFDLKYRPQTDERVIQAFFNREGKGYFYPLSDVSSEILSQQLAEVITSPLKQLPKVEADESGIKRLDLGEYTFPTTIAEDERFYLRVGLISAPPGCLRMLTASIRRHEASPSIFLRLDYKDSHGLLRFFDIHFQVDPETDDLTAIGPVIEQQGDVMAIERQKELKAPMVRSSALFLAVDILAKDLPTYNRWHQAVEGIYPLTWKEKEAGEQRERQEEFNRLATATLSLLAPYFAKVQVLAPHPETAFVLKIDETETEIGRLQLERVQIEKDVPLKVKIFGPKATKEIPPLYLSAYILTPQYEKAAPWSNELLMYYDRQRIRFQFGRDSEGNPTELQAIHWQFYDRDFDRYSTFSTIKPEEVGRRILANELALLHYCHSVLQKLAKED